MSDALLDRGKYGPWAVIAGGSDGTGACFAYEAAKAGINLVLIARRPAPLATLADSLRHEFGVEVRTLSLDLNLSDAAARMQAATEDLEVGLYVHNAGAATTLGPFLDMPVETMRDLVARNVIAVMEACSNFGRPMRIRGRGGIVLMGSGAGLGGQPGLAVYSGVKGFMLNLAESLWSELRHAGVDVVGIAAPMMDTPTLRRSLGDTKMTGIYDPAEVVRTALLHLGNGPSYVYALDPSEQVFERETAARKERVLAVERVSAALLGGD